MAARTSHRLAHEAPDETAMANPYDVLRRAADAVASRLGRAPVGAVLGSGLSECLDTLASARFMEYGEIPGMPEPGVSGHRGALIHGKLGGVDVLALCGRVHMYEGVTREQVAAPVRLLSLLGVHSLVVTSAVHSLAPDMRPGTLMLVEDHMNLSRDNVLAGDHDPRLGPQFVDMHGAYDHELREILARTAELTGHPLRGGVIAHVLGPSFETPAEARLASSAGASVLSTSMVPDVLVARQRGMRVAGIGCVTAMAANLREQPVNRDRALVGSAAYAGDIQELLSGALPQMATYPASATD